MQNYPSDYIERQNFLGIIQLRRSLSLGVNIKVESAHVCMTYNDDEMCFEEYDSNLIAFPGTQYFMIDVSDIEFEVKDNWLVLRYFFKNEEFSIELIKI